MGLSICQASLRPMRVKHLRPCKLQDCNRHHVTVLSRLSSLLLPTAYMASKSNPHPHIVEILNFCCSLSDCWLASPALFLNTCHCRHTNLLAANADTIKTSTGSMFKEMSHRCFSAASSSAIASAPAAKICSARCAAGSPAALAFNDSFRRRPPVSRASSTMLANASSKPLQTQNRFIPVLSFARFMLALLRSAESGEGC